LNIRVTAHVRQEGLQVEAAGGVEGLVEHFVWSVRFSTSVKS
jgi:hypothetical protein